jgi:hypothetical protein
VQAGRIKGVQVAGKRNGCGWADVRNGTGGRHGMGVEGTWNGCGWQAHGIGVGGRHVEWMRVGGWQSVEQV